MATNILDQLQSEARRLRVGQRLPQDGSIPDHLIVAVRDDLKFMIDQPGVTIDKLAQAMGDGYSRGTLSRFVNLTTPADFGGDVQRAARGINQFLETIARRREGKLPTGFVETEVARRILLVIAKTIELCGVGLVTGDAGRGKTLTMEAAHELHPGSVLLRVRQTTTRAPGIARRLAELLDLRGCRAAHVAESRVINRLRGTGRCILVDEAHKLDHGALELLRDIHDETGCPIVLAGTINLAASVADADVFFGQFTSRIVIRYDITEHLRTAGDHDPQPIHSLEEIKRLYESDKVRFTDEGRLLLTKVANLPGLGGLRMVAKIVQVAQALSGGTSGGGDPIDPATLLRVMRTLHGIEYTGHIERQIDAARVA